MKVNRPLIFFLIISVFAILGVSFYLFKFLPEKRISEIGDCVPINFRKIDEDAKYYLIWNTKNECTGYVRYGTSDASFPYVALDLQGVVKLKEHRVLLNGVDKGSKYFFVIISEEKNYGNGSLPISITFE